MPSTSDQARENTEGKPPTHSETTKHYKLTGKERDSESGLDTFGARHYASNVGRWISPDWAQKPEAVPYSKLDDPQTLNLYEYVGNNPLSKADSDGHCWPICDLIAPVSVYIGTHPDIGRAIDRFTDSLGFKASAGVGTKGSVSLGETTVKLGAAATVSSEVRMDGTSKGAVNLTGSASIAGVGPQVNGSATFMKNGELVNPAANLSGNARLTDSTKLNDVTNSAAAIGTDGRVAVGLGVNAGVMQAGVQVTAGTQQTKGVLSSVGDAVMQDVRQTIRDAKESLTCSTGGCAHP